jgi:hypothetical protein
MLQALTLFDAHQALNFKMKNWKDLILMCDARKSTTEDVAAQIEYYKRTTSHHWSEFAIQRDFHA